MRIGVRPFHLYFHWCFHRYCRRRVFLWREPRFWMLHVGPVEVSNWPIY